MIELIWHMRGSVALMGSGNLALDRIESLLSAQYKHKRERGEHHVSFEDPLWLNMLGPNWLAMVIYDRGRFWIESSPSGQMLRYDLRSLHGFIFCLFGAVMFFGFGTLDGGIPSGLRYAAFAFSWLYGMNILLAYLRVPRAIRNAIRT